MVRRLSCLAVLQLLAVPLYAQETADPIDPTDLSRYDDLVEESSLIDLEQLIAMETAARSAFDSGNCEEAVELLVEWSEATNMISNIIRQGLEPFYGARSDDQDQIVRDRSLMNQLATGERQVNSLLRSRNEAWVMEAECLINMGEREQGVTRLYRALDYISGTEERVLWDRARTLLWEHVGYQP